MNSRRVDDLDICLLFRCCKLILRRTILAHRSAVINLGKNVSKFLSETIRGAEREFCISDYLGEFGEAVALDKGEVVFHQGDSNGYIYLIQAGLLKAYYVTAEGKEYVKSFLMESDIIGNLTALMSAEGCSFTLICLEPSSLIRVPFGEILKQAKRDLAVANQLNLLLANLAIKKERREYEFLCLSAEERYRILRETTPELLERVTKNDIARYLGITPVALSRIRTRIRG